MLMGEVIFSLNLIALGWLATLAVSLLTLFYAIRIPLKRTYNYIYILFVVDTVIWSSLVFYSQTADSTETFYARAWWNLLVGSPPQRLAILYSFTIFFVHSKPGRIRYTLLPLFAWAFAFIGMLLVDRTLIFSRPRITPIGFGSGPGSLTPYLAPYAVDITTTIITILIVALLLGHYRLQRSSVTRGQIRYLLGGVLLVAAAAYSFYVAQYLGGISLLSYLSAASIAVMLMGLRKHGFFAITPQPETQSKVPLRFDLAQGASYLAFEPEPKQSFEIFSNLALNGRNGLCITRSFPESIRETYGLKATPILWLTEEKSDNVIAPSDLNGLLVTIQVFLERAERPVVILQGIGFLASTNGFRPVMRLIARLSDANLRRDGIMIFSAVPGTLTDGQITMLSEECPSLQRLDVSRNGEAVTSPLQPLQEIHPLLMKNASVPAEPHTQEPLQFRSDEAEKVFKYLAKAFLMDYTVHRIIVDSAGWRTAMEIADGTKLPARKMYGRNGGPGQAIAELLKRGLVETRWVTGQRGRGGTVMKVRANHTNPYVKEEIDRMARQP